MVSGIMRENWIGNKYVIRSIRVESIADKMRENKPRWFGHVMKKKAAVNRVVKMNVEGKRGWKRSGWMRLKVIWGFLMCA